MAVGPMMAIQAKSKALIALATGFAAAIGMDAFHIVHVEIGPSGIQAESKFSQIGPSPRKDNPRKRLGFPWISLSELSLFKACADPLARKYLGLPSPRPEAQSCNGICARAVPRSSLAPGRPMWLRSSSPPIIAMISSLGKRFFETWW